MRKPLLFLPGPMQVPDHIRSAGDRPLFSHRSPQMLDMLAKLEAGCWPLFGTKASFSRRGATLLDRARPPVARGA